jgi:N-methylhydantoinase A
MVRLGVDIGGTFTDAVCFDERTGHTYMSKVPTTPQDLTVGFMNSLQRVLAQSQYKQADISYLVHGTTVATNALLEHRGSKTAMITTKGFRDVIEIGTQLRPKLYDTFQTKPPSVVPRYLRFEVTERVGSKGEVVRPLVEHEVLAIVQQLRELSVGSVAICLLFSFLNPGHERRIGKIIKSNLPEVDISLSSDVCPEFREYWRFSTTAVNASVVPLVAGYLNTVEKRLASLKVHATLLVMQSNGGTYTFESAKRKPVYMIESGPAAGVIAAQAYGQDTNNDNLVSFDMGGTTAKAGLIENGKPQLVGEYEVGGSVHGRLSGAGYPIRAPTIDLAEVGTGGGSIGWIDKGGELKVGPVSAGAEPGPVCYGKGGTEPTVTDANIILGRTSANYFLGGEMKIDAKKAEESIRTKIADQLGLDLYEAAAGIVRVANSNMSKAIRLVSTQRGYDPRDFAILAFGGAGPVHAGELAEELEMKKIIVPPLPGALSAEGLLMSDVRHDFSTTFLKPLGKVEAWTLNEKYHGLGMRATEVLEREGIPNMNIRILRSADMRYLGQAYEITIPLPNSKLSQKDIESLRARFHEAHQMKYGHAAVQEPVELVNVRVTGLGRFTKMRRRPIKKSRRRTALKEKRRVYFAGTERFEVCGVYERSRLGRGETITGPALIEQIDSTTLVEPNSVCTVDRFGNLILKDNG